ncbi:cytochrome-c peroxidase [Alkalilimnicola ehrlichii]|uniref:Methylamine utilization protein MauG n=2 Tax=Alkalilimnicola ehrlichii TaxID=351052 RepID=A0A3E0WKH7_9GAMM|nr:cytochrome-c peroxidase [Alkalilimnicola ehrlichii]RFA32435.1 cytochrome-c peroxidase [Alkalilimnicola ehrlichii]
MHAVGAEDDLRALYSQAPEQWPQPHLDEGVEHRELGLLPPMPEPKTNPTTAEKVELGKKLFFDPRLSGSQQLACATCHDPQLGWGDGRSTAFGHDRQLGARNSQSIINSGYMTTLFWDGRAGSLEEQALEPIVNPIEMHNTLAGAEATLNAIPGYVELFRAAFGVEHIERTQIAQALAAFQRTIVSRKSRFDRFLDGEHALLSEEELLGLHLFRTRARCMNCHSGPLLSDGQFHNLGLHFYGRRLEDLGRYHVTGRPADVGRFRTPGLRDAMFTGPWMHNGRITDMTSLLRMYNHGMARRNPTADQADDPLFPVTSPLLQPLDLDEYDIAALKAFMHALSARPRPVRPPELPPSIDNAHLAIDRDSKQP